MASLSPPRSGEEMVLFAVEQPLEEVWAVLKAHDPHSYVVPKADFSTRNVRAP
jgi:hypothetical protein